MQESVCTLGRARAIASRFRPPVRALALAASHLPLSPVSCPLSLPTAHCSSTISTGMTSSGVRTGPSSPSSRATRRLGVPGQQWWRTYLSPSLRKLMLLSRAGPGLGRTLAEGVRGQGPPGATPPVTHRLLGQEYVLSRERSRLSVPHPVISPPADRNWPVWKYFGL